SKTRLEIPRDERVRRDFSALGVTAREIHAAHRAEPRVRTKSRAREIEVRIENVGAMLPRRQSIVDDQREHDVARGRFAVGNIFAPTAAEISVARDPLSGVAAIAPFMTESAIRLVGAMIGRGATHPARKAERRKWLRALEETDCFMDRSRVFPGSNTRVARKENDIAVHAAAP